MRIRSIRLLGTLVLTAAAVVTNAADPVAPAAPDAGAATRKAAAAPAGLPAKAQFHIRPVDDAWRPRCRTTPKAATQAYLDRLPADVVARSNAYSKAATGCSCGTACSAWRCRRCCCPAPRSTRLRDWAERAAARPLRDAAYGAAGVAAGWLLAAADGVPGSSANTPTAWRRRPSAAGSVSSWSAWRSASWSARCWWRLFYAVLRRAGASLVAVGRGR